MGVMILSREVRRVPLDWDFPVDKTWTGYLRPPDLDPPVCEVCGPPTELLHGTASYGGTGDGYSPEARQLAFTWYAHNLMQGWNYQERGELLCWHNKLGQPEVDALIEAGRFNPVIDCPRGCEKPPHGPGWQTDCPDCGGKGWTRRQLNAGDITAAQVNAPDFVFHDSINQSICVRTRCELLGFPYTCEWCDGDGIGGLDEQRLRYETWAPTEPPTGEAYQLWQTVTEGGPCSPPFATLEELAAWLSREDTSILKDKSIEEWMSVLRGEVFGTDIHSGALVK